NIFPWGSYIWEHTYPKLRDALDKRKVSHDDKREKGEEIRYTMTGFVYAFMGDARISTLTQTVSSLQGTIDNLESRLLALEGDERDFGVVSDGDIPAYMSPGPSYTSPTSLHRNLSRWLTDTNYVSDALH
nr:hypothetical protein [Tanacetum cinerariifolium]